MKLQLIVIGCLIGASFFVSCQNEKTAEEMDNCEKPSLNPNGDSEMALLMRAMESDLKAQRAALLEGTTPPPITANVEDMLSATPSDESFLNSNFEGFVGVMKASFNAYTALEGNEGRIEAYNNVVTGCVTCHQSYCPGPVKRLQKLIISQ
jgi:hypothetical protein